MESVQSHALDHAVLPVDLQQDNHVCSLLDGRDMCMTRANLGYGVKKGKVNYGAPQRYDDNSEILLHYTIHNTLYSRLMKMEIISMDKETMDSVQMPVRLTFLFM